MNQHENCSEALAGIEVYRQAFLAMKSDITPRLISWGSIAISKERPRFNLEKGTSNLEGYQLWRRVRGNLSASALMKLHQILKAEYETAIRQQNEQIKAG